MKRDRLRWLTARPIAHRGYHDIRRGRPENTLAAFDAAIEHHYAIECDLHISADGIPVVFHDDDLERLTGTPGCVRDFTAVELGNLRLGGTGEWIPTLDELLSLVEGRVPLIIELKHLAGRNAGFAFEVVERLQRYPGSAALMSFDPGLVMEVRAVDPTMPRGLTAMGDWRKSASLFKLMFELGIDFISYGINDLPTPMPIIANRLFGIPLICWTVRTKPQSQKAMRWTDQMTFEGFRP